MDVAQNAPKTIILAEDEAGLYLQATTTPVWYPIGQTPIIRVSPGREKVCFYGTVNLLTGQEVAMRSPVMNSEVTAQHLTQLLQTYPNNPILLFWDRARWHRGSAVEQVLKDNPRLEVSFFPMASPEMNPQEQVWKATRKAISHNHCELRLPELVQRFGNHLNSNSFPCSLLDCYGYNTICPMFI